MNNLLQLDIKYQDYIFHDKLKNALHLSLNTDNNIFIQGPAGTGKSLFLNILRNELDYLNSSYAVCTPTGVSAVNVKGVTLNSFFQIEPGISVVHYAKSKLGNKTLRDKLSGLKYLIIDEISMVRADMFTIIDYMLQQVKKDFRAFGGIKVIILGDLLQLSPVLQDKDVEYFSQFYPNGKFFFNTDAYIQGNFKYIEFDKIFRQSNVKFGELLNRMRKNEINELDLRVLNTRVTSDYSLHDSDTVYLASTRKKVQQINKMEYDKIKEKEYRYIASFDADNFKSKAEYPNDEEIVLKKGVKVMFIVNSKEYVNGTVGFIKDLDKESVTVEINDDYEKRTIKVEPYEWGNFGYKIEIDEKTKEKKLIKYKKGSFKQIPLKIAYAITVHKSQSKTLNSIYLDLGWKAFAGGMTYVAVSRIRDFKGLSLKRPITQGDIFVDKEILNFSKDIIEIDYDDIDIKFVKRKEIISKVDNNKEALDDINEILKEYGIHE